MNVFVTGATGFVGTAVVAELINAGHRVTGLARSDQGADRLTHLGATVHRGSLEDPDSLRSGAAASDGVIHTAFIHDFGNYGPAAEADHRAIETMGAVLAGSDRPLIVTAGTAGLAPGQLVTEDVVPGQNGQPIMRFSEVDGIALAEKGVRASVMRLPPSVHGAGDHGFVPQLITIAREKGVSGYPGDGSTRWAAVHRLDAARLYRLALEKAPAGTRLQAIGDEGVTALEIAIMIGRHLNIPVVSVPPDEVAGHFGWLGMFFALDMPASGAVTRDRFNWQPTQPGLIADLDQDHYFTGQALHN